MESPPSRDPGRSGTPATLPAVPDVISADDVPGAPDPVVPSGSAMDGPPATPAETATGRGSWRGDPWVSARIMGVVAYLISRGFVLAGGAAIATERAIAARPKDVSPEIVPLEGNALKGMIDVLLDWDSAWYLRIVRMGYPQHVIPNVTFGDDSYHARAAFFPVYPFLVRALDRVLPGGDVWVAITLNFLLGLAFVLVVGKLARRAYGVEAAQRAMVLTAMFPGSFVLLYAYSEATMLLAMALCLWWLGEKRWWAAGLAAAIVTAARPNGLAAAVACAVAALIAIRRDREWKALIAPVLAPVGWLAFQILLSIHAHERGVWFRVQREAWDEGLSFGGTALSNIWKVIKEPLGSPGGMFTLGSIAAMLFMLYGSRRIKMRPEWWGYSIAILALMLLPSTVTARPRFLYTAFPLLIGFAAWWPKRRHEWWGFIMAACGAGLVAVTAVYGARGAIP